MPAHLNQHYLPCAYLRHFSEDGIKGGRQSNIWRIDATGQQSDTVEAQCSEPYFYSRRDAAAVEAEFGKLESAYGQITSKFWRGENPTNLREYFCLLVMMIDLHLRNRRYQTGAEDNYRHYTQRYAALRAGILFPESGDPAEDAEVVRLFREHWRVRIVRPRNGRSFITSDNPCVWFNGSAKFGDVHLMLLPVTPCAYAVAYDERVFKFTMQTVTEDDEVAFTHLQGRQAVEALFTHERLTAEQVEGVRRLLVQPKIPAEIRPDGSWVPDILQFPESRPFSFVRRLPTS